MTRLPMTMPNKQVHAIIVNAISYYFAAIANFLTTTSLPMVHLIR